MGESMMTSCRRTLNVAAVAFNSERRRVVGMLPFNSEKSCQSEYCSGVYWLSVRRELCA